MIDSTEERLKIRMYLLGQLNDPDCERIEEQFLTNQTYREEVLIVEEDLVDEYITRKMSAKDVAQFDSFYLSTPQKREKLLIANAVDSYYKNASAQRVRNVGAHTSFQPAWRRISRPTAYAAVAILVLFISVIGWWFLSTRPPETLFGNYQAELQRINDRTSAVRADYSVAVPPNVIRQGTESTIAVLPKNASVVELLLILPDITYDKYLAIVHATGRAGEYTFNDLVLTTTVSGKSLSIKFPANALDRDSYFVEVKGIKQGSAENVADYSFEVKRTEQ
jgi:hypothetical protein